MGRKSKNEVIKCRRVVDLFCCIAETIQHFANKGPSSQGYGFSSSHIWMWELDYKESWVPKNWCFWTVVLEKTLESPLDCQEIQPVHPKGNQSWIFIGRTDAELKLQYFGNLMQKVTHWKRSWCWERLRAKGEEGSRGWDGWWHHRFIGYELGQILGASEGQWALACCSPWVSKSQIRLIDWTTMYVCIYLSTYSGIYHTWCSSTA